MSRRHRVVGYNPLAVWLLILLVVILVISVTLIVFVVAPRVERQAEIEQHYGAGLAFSQVGDWQAAADEFRQVVALDATYLDTQAQMNQALANVAAVQSTATAQIVAMAAQQQRDATATAEAAITATSQALEHRYARAEGLINMGFWLEAQADLRAIFDEQPDYREVQSLLATVSAEVAGSGVTRTDTLASSATVTPIPMITPTFIPTSTPAVVALAPHGETYTEPVSGMTLVRVPAGEFIMGNSEDQIEAVRALCLETFGEDDCNNWIDLLWERATPQQIVDLEEFWIGQTEVTNAQWQLFMEAGGYDNPDYWTETGWQKRKDNDLTSMGCWDDSDVNQPDQPVVCISWYEALAYTRWLAKASGLAVRLPSEAEWEKAARGPSTGSGAGRIYPWGDEWDGSRLNYCDVNCPVNGWKDETVDDGYARIAPVGFYPQGASPYGALDMAGNVWEWTSSEYRDYPYAADDGRDELEGDVLRTVRGGSLTEMAAGVGCGARADTSPHIGVWDLGFRVVSSPLAVGR